MLFSHLFPKIGVRFYRQDSQATPSHIRERTRKRALMAAESYVAATVGSWRGGQPGGAAITIAKPTVPRREPRAECPQNLKEALLCLCICPRCYQGSPCSRRSASPPKCHLVPGCSGPSPASEGSPFLALMPPTWVCSGAASRASPWPLPVQGPVPLFSMSMAPQPPASLLSPASGPWAPLLTQLLLSSGLPSPGPH